MKILTFILNEKFSLIVVALIEFIVGFVIILHVDIISVNPIILFLIPSLMNLRGSIYSTLALRVIKFLYIGKAYPSLKDPLIQEEIYAAFIRSISISLILGLIAYIFQILFFIENLTLLEIFTLSILTNFLSYFIIVFPITSLLFYYFKKGRLIEFVGAPYVTAIADLITPFILFLVFSLIFIFYFQIFFLLSLFIGIIIFAFFKFRNGKTFKNFILSIITGKTHVEKVHLIYFVHAITAIFSGLGGLFYAKFIIFKTIQEILIAAPAINALLGALGGILASRTSIILHLGRSFSLFKIIYDLRIAYISFYIGLIFISYFTGFIGIQIIFISSIFHILFITYLSYYFTVLTFKRNLDPDNFTMPIITTAGDLIGPALVIIIFLFLFG